MNCFDLEALANNSNEKSKLKKRCVDSGLHRLYSADRWVVIGLTVDTGSEFCPRRGCLGQNNEVTLLPQCSAEESKWTGRKEECSVLSSKGTWVCPRRRVC